MFLYYINVSLTPSLSKNYIEETSQRYKTRNGPKELHFGDQTGTGTCRAEDC